jgi:hypothetical protein
VALAAEARPTAADFVADDDAASGQQLLHHTKAERGKRKYSGTAWPVISAGNRDPAYRARARHPIRLLTRMRPRKHGRSTKLTVPMPPTSRNINYLR